MFSTAFCLAPHSTHSTSPLQDSLALFNMQQRKRKLIDQPPPPPAPILQQHHLGLQGLGGLVAKSLDYPFSTLMRSMAARHHLRNHVLAVLSPPTTTATGGGGASANLAAAAAAAAAAINGGVVDTPPHKRIKVEEPLDLSLLNTAESSMASESVEQKYSIDRENRFKDISAWDVDRVASFVSGIDNTSDSSSNSDDSDCTTSSEAMAAVFRRQRVDGAELIRMTFDDLTSRLGIPTQHAVKILTTIHRKRCSV